MLIEERGPRFHPLCCTLERTLWWSAKCVTTVPLTWDWAGLGSRGSVTGRGRTGGRGVSCVVPAVGRRGEGTPEDLETL